jgi:hypothetical protein
MKIAIVNTDTFTVDIKTDLDKLSHGENTLDNIYSRLNKSTKHLVTIEDSDNLVESIAHKTGYQDEQGIIDHTPIEHLNLYIQMFHYRPTFNEQRKQNILCSFLSYTEQIYGPAVLIAHRIDNGKYVQIDMTLDIWCEIIAKRMYGTAVYLRCDGTTHQFYFYDIHQLMNKVFSFVPPPKRIVALKYGLDIYTTGERPNPNASLLAGIEIKGDCLILHNLGDEIIGHLSENELQQIIIALRYGRHLADNEEEASRYQILSLRKL